jgi:hypothetical protein
VLLLLTGLVPAVSAQSFEWHAFGIASYTFNTNKPTSGVNTLRTFDSDHRRWRPQMIGLSVMRRPTPFGLQVDLATGDDVPVMAALGAWDPTVADLAQAFVSWRPGSGNLELRGGKFVTTAGYEVIPTWDNPNLTYSRSFLFGYSIPFTHTGLRAIWTRGPFTFLGGVNRGWDKWEDNNGAVSLEASVSFAQPTFSVTFDTHHGPEQDDRSIKRRLYDLAATVKPSADWSVGFNGDYGTEADASWYGAAGYLSWAVTPAWTASLRLEQFKDVDGVRTGDSQTLSDLDLTVDWHARRGVLVRFDTRYDHSTAAVFEKQAQPSRHQATAAVAFVLSR